MTEELKTFTSMLEQEEAGTGTFPCPDDPFAQYRLSQDFAATAAVAKVITTVAVRKPDRQTFIRVHADHAIQAYILEDKVGGDTFIVSHAVAAEIANQVVPKWPPTIILAG